jgi:K+-transporting ATPase ATPase C chain
MIREIAIALRSTLILWVLTALIYPLLMIGIGEGIFPYQANGSLIKDNQGQIIGSALIGQNFSSPQYFRSRPSVINYGEGEDYQKTGISGASNLAPSNPALLERITQTTSELKQVGIVPSADLVYTSGSGLEPHSTIETARSQIERVAKERNLNPQDLENLINKYTEGRFLGIFGEPGVNVLKLNLALDNRL